MSNMRPEHRQINRRYAPRVHRWKNGLLELVRQSGRAHDCTVRIACHELESFYLGDLEAVEVALGVCGLSKLQNKRSYRSPDDLANAQEELKKLTLQRYTKISGSRAIGAQLRLDGSNRSRSFLALCRSIKAAGDS